MSIKLRELIRNIRSCKTAAEERSVVAKECALIRTAFKEEDKIYRHRNVAKLLFINMLGYPTHFGQIECLKLIASDKFSYKRIGYLGLTILLDENTDILMLVTNSIKNDLRNNNQYVNGLALCALGNIANNEMCSALSHEIFDLININNPYVKKKAAMCAIRILKKTNDIEELVLDKISNLLDDRNHGVLSAGVSLMITLIEKKSLFINILKNYTNKIIKILKSCIMSGYSHGAEYDICGINDPFLQVKILKLLKYLNDDYSANDKLSEEDIQMANCLNGVNNRSGNNSNPYDLEEVNSILSQVATNTDSMVNVGNAILYECVKTITYVSTDPGLIALAVNVLGKFLQNSDNNIRYVGLCTLQKLLKKDPKTLHIYRNTIIECLKDQDISIRKKALDVAFALITKDSLKTMVKELLNYLLVADIEIKSDIVSNICVSINKYSPNTQYLLDTYIKLFCLAGNFIQDHIKDDFIYYILQNPEYHSYVVFKLFFSIKENLDQYALIQVGIWFIGEFGNLLVQEKNIGPDKEVITVTCDDVFDLLEKVSKKYEGNNIKELHNISIKDPIHNIIYNKSLNILEDNSNNSNSYVCCNINENVNNDDNNIILQYILMCLNKLTVRFPSQKDKIEKLIQRYKNSKFIEIQQRACEFHEFMNPQWDNIRDYVLLRIPCNKKKKEDKLQQQEQEMEDHIICSNNADTSNKSNLENQISNDNSGDAYVDLLDLDGILGLQSSNNCNKDNIIKNHVPDVNKYFNKNDNLDINEDFKIRDNLGINDPFNIDDGLNINESITNKETIIDGFSNTSTKNNTYGETVNKKNEDILADLFGNISENQLKENPQSAPDKRNNSLNMFLSDIQTSDDNDIFNLNLIDDKIDNKIQISPLKIYEKNDIEILFNFQKEHLDSETTIIKAIYSNKSNVLINSFIFEAIVPNYIKLEIFSASSTELLPLEKNKITQELKIDNKMFKKKPVLMKVRLSYFKNNEKFQDFINIGNFPDAL